MTDEKFDKLKSLLPAKHWAKYDLSAYRLGAEAMEPQIKYLKGLLEECFNAWQGTGPAIDLERLIDAINEE